MEGIHFAFDYQHNYRCATADHLQLRILFDELVVELEECFVHQNFHHLVQVTGLVEQLGPLAHFSYQVGLYELRALGTTVAVHDCEQTDKLPLATSDIFLYGVSIFHRCSKSYVLTCSSIEPGHLER